MEKLPSSKKKILLIDDEVDIVRLTELRLKAKDFEVIYSYTGKEGIKKAIAQRPDLILTDVVMPDIDGFEVCRRLKLDPRTREIPVILFSGKEIKDAPKKARQAGAEAFYYKPFWPAGLIRRLQDILSKPGLRNRR
jgi:CheY-like chemotaxis protein